MLSLRFDELRFVPLSLDETDEQWERGKDDRFNCLPMPKKGLSFRILMLRGSVVFCRRNSIDQLGREFI